MDCPKKIIVYGFLLLVSSSAFALNLPREDVAMQTAFCKEEWSKRGNLDVSMFNYCMERERDGYYEIVALARKYSGQRWIQAALDLSLKKWTKRGIRDDAMAAYELRQITEGFEDMVYMSKQPGWNSSKYTACVNQWGVDFNMVAYCYKN